MYGIAVSFPSPGTAGRKASTWRFRNQFFEAVRRDHPRLRAIPFISLTARGARHEEVIRNAVQYAPPESTITEKSARKPPALAVGMK
ncbi:MAG: hypothetical protein ACUVSU_09135, partial [Aggregatilineaceae bacterium]